LFSPFFTENINISFYGGEPLLAFDTIEQTLHYLRKKVHPNRSVNYSLTTNGSLLTKDILSVLDEFKFEVVLSFDGLSQNITRKENSFTQLVGTIETIKTYPRIALSTQSVFVPETVSFLSGSIQFIVDMGIKSVDFNLDYIRPWNRSDLRGFEREVQKIRKMAQDHYNKNGKLPVEFLNKSDSYGIAVCEGGKESMTLVPDGSLWGCSLLFDYASSREDETLAQVYSFGAIEDFIRHHKVVYPQIRRNYSQIRLDRCHTDKTPCVKCLDLLRCTLCPIAACFGSKEMWTIPDWVCEIRRILTKENESFWSWVGSD